MRRISGAVLCLVAQLWAPPSAWPLENDASDRIRLSISGQVNRAVNLVHDGGDTDLFFVDNGTSSSRLRGIVTGRVNDDLSVGARIEVSAAPDDSSEVSQTNPAPGTDVDQRWAEVSVTSARYGKLSLGKGDTASKSTAEVDLSLTDVVQFAGVADIAGGMLFRERGNDGRLTSIKVEDVFEDWDGLSRQSRLRYDTPSWRGLSLAGSLIANRRRDAAVFWGGEAGGLTAAGAAAVSRPNLEGVGLQYDGSLSVLHRGSGLNLTLSAGMLERKVQRDPANLYGKIGWIADLISLGRTAFGVDCTRSANLPASRDEAWSLSVAAVQAIDGIDGIAIELYLLYRLYVLDRASGPQVESIAVSTVGARVKF